MLRYRKLWLVISAFILIFFVIASFIKPDLVTVVPNQHQLNNKKPDLELHHIPEADSSVHKSHVKDDSTDRNGR